MPDSDISFWWLVGWWAFSAAVQALPEPLPMERWYGALYRFLHFLGANFPRLSQLKRSRQSQIPK